MGSLGGFRGAEPRPKRAKNLWKTRVFVHVDILWTKMGIFRHLAAILGRFGAVFCGRLGAILGCLGADLGAILGHLGPSWGYLGPS